MTKAEYMASKHMHVYGCGNLEEELDDEFKNIVDKLAESYEEIYNEEEECEV